LQASKPLIPAPTIATLFSILALCFDELRRGQQCFETNACNEPGFKVRIFYNMWSHGKLFCLKYRKWY
jgi:hypothetical protein